MKREMNVGGGWCSTEEHRNEGATCGFSGEAGMVITWTVSLDGRVLREGIQAMIGQQGRLTGNSKFKLAVLWEMKAQGW